MSSRSSCLTAVFLALGAFGLSHQAKAILIASDDAAQPAYDDGWSAGDNGGSGFLPWSFLGRDNDIGFGGGFISSNHPAVDIGSGPNDRAFGVFGNQGGVGAAVRPLDGALQVGWTFSIDMDNQSIDSGGTVGFSLRNSAGSNLAEFYFIGGQTHYTVNAADVSGTTPGFTTDGLRLSFTLTDADSFQMTIDELSTVGVDHTVTGRLFSDADQSIADFRLFNANGGADVFFNNFSLTAIPEASSFLFGGLVCSIAGVCWGWSALRRKRPAATADAP